MEVAIKHLTDFAQYDYDCLKLLREIQLLKQIHVTSNAGVCCFIPEILDVVVPDGQGEKNLKNIFIVMEYE